MLCSFLSTGLLPPWLGLFLGTLFFLLLYQMGFISWYMFLQFHWCKGMPFFFKYIYWLCYYSCPTSPPTPLHPAHPPPSHTPPHSSCPWVILISSLASTFPTLFLPSPCLFSTYHLCYLFSVPLPPLPLPLPYWQPSCSSCLPSLLSFLFYLWSLITVSLLSFLLFLFLIFFFLGNSL